MPANLFFGKLSKPSVPISMGWMKGDLLTKLSASSGG
jgi:hypothetical protein